MNQQLKLCAFADEADPQLDAQIDMMVTGGIPYLEMRGVDGKNVADLTEDEVKHFHLSTLRLTYEEALREYELRKSTSLGRLIAERELPILKRAKEIIDSL